MFYEIKNLTCSVDLAPQYFGPRLKEAVARLVVEKVQWSRITHETVEGFAVHAYVPDIGSYDLTKGKIHEDTGAVQFHVKYNAIVMRPRVNDVFDAYVTNVEQSGVTCHFGPLYIFISYMSLGEFQEYDSSGLFRQIEADEDGNVESISAGSVIRLKVVRVTHNSKGMDVFGTIEGETCGLIADPV